MARTPDQIFSELDRFFNPSAQIIKERKSLIPGQIASATKGLETRKDNEFRDITSRANQRGVIYSGLPIQEEARYTGEQFLPALASLRQTGQEQTLSLAESLAGLRREQGLMAQSLRQGELTREAEERAARRAAAAALAAAPNPNFNTPETETQSLPGVGLKNSKLGGKGGFSFKFSGRPVSAYSYSRLNNLNIADLLYTMANQGDSYAGRAYEDIVNTGGNVTPSLMSKYSALFWQPQSANPLGGGGSSTGTLMPGLGR